MIVHSPEEEQKIDRLLHSRTTFALVDSEGFIRYVSAYDRIYPLTNNSRGWRLNLSFDTIVHFPQILISRSHGARIQRISFTIGTTIPVHIPLIDNQQQPY